MSTKSYSKAEIDSAISDYKKKRKNNPDTHIAYVKSLRNFRDVITASCIAIDGNGQKHIHQYRMNNGRLRKFAHKLLEREQDLLHAENFDRIFEIVSTIRVFGLGAVVYYDTSLRIAHTRTDCLPDKIYLIKEILKGARNLGIETKGKKHIFKNELPSPISTSDLECWEVADLLCCFFSEGKWKDCLEFAV
ncbi:MAG: hypothetical protein K0S32_4107 [Bacteroidetes bacterium]|jgi:hypothetical protein|nr:hypothetical protein [Bacteroidota bacterium]